MFHPLYFLKENGLRGSLVTVLHLGSVVSCYDSGWMDADKFVQLMQHFIKCVKPNADKKVLPVLDGNKSHTKEIEGH